MINQDLETHLKREGYVTHRSHHMKALTEFLYAENIKKAREEEDYEKVRRITLNRLKGDRDNLTSEDEESFEVITSDTRGVLASIRNYFREYTLIEDTQEIAITQPDERLEIIPLVFRGEGQEIAVFPSYNPAKKEVEVSLGIYPLRTSP